MTGDAATCLARVLDAERRGEFLTAYDLADRGIAAHPSDVRLKHRAVLALARSGSTAEAQRRLHDYGLHEVEEEDVAALGARLTKDAALAARGDERRVRAAESAAQYEAIFRRTGGTYSAINAATMSLVSGDVVGARALAREVLAIAERTADASYYAHVTEAEALLLLGDVQRAGRALQRALEAHDGDLAAVATTRRQLRVACETSGLDPGVLEALRQPDVVHFAGHRIATSQGAGRFLASAEAEVSRLIAARLDAARIAFAYGSLASGADILFAEALSERGIDVHVVLPFALDDFVAHSVADAGTGWVSRFEHCLSTAAEVVYATDDAFLGDDVLYRYGAELAMGLALLRARNLDADARQLVVWDGDAARGGAGTAIDVAAWRRTACPQEVLWPRPRNPRAPRPRVRTDAEARPGGRVIRAMLFADIKGFSALPEQSHRSFADTVLGAFAAVLETHAGTVRHQNTWGDAIYVVLEDAEAAAACALDLQEAFSAIALEAAGLPTHLALRLGAHVGPVFAVEDPVIGRRAFMGSHVSRTARIEPVTPPGEIYVTDAFAAALMLTGRQDLRCDYVGHMPAAKGYGRLRMYRLRRIAAPAAQ